MWSNNVFVGHCQKCHEPIGEMTREELDFVVFNSDQQLLCFDCELPQAMRIYDNYLGLADGGTVRIDNVVFDVGGEKLLSVNDSLTRAHERTRARGLSSSTYLNRILQDSGVLEFIDRGKHCLTCDGFGDYWYLDNQVACSACGGIGRIGDKVLLPLWLVNGVRENA